MINIKHKIINVKNDKYKCHVIFNSLNLYSIRHKDFDNKFIAAKDLIFCNDVDFSYSYDMVHVLIYYGILELNGDKVNISKNFKILNNFSELMFLLNNNMNLKTYNRIKKIKKINDKKYQDD